MICGVDEAGKGSVLGPLVIAGVSGASEDIFTGLGVKDSKVLSSRERERLYSLIKKQCRVAVVRIEPDEIDETRNSMSMNTIVARAHARVITRLEPALAYVDACDTNPFRYAGMVKGNLAHACEIISEHHADMKFPAVSAASIIAKVTRDRAVAQLSKTYGEIGSGYPSDPVTIQFLEVYIAEHDCPPPIARRSWKTVLSIMARMSQSSLADFS